jgi:hypothetical protein
MHPQIAPSDGDSAIVFWLEAADAESDTQTVKARKIGAAGEPLWAEDTVLVSDHPIPAYSDLAVKPDKTGGAFLVWVEAAGLRLNSVVQRVANDGSAAMTPPDGVLLSLSQTTSQFDPFLAFAPFAQEIIAIWEESNIDQTASGIYAQLFSYDGVRMWGDNGVSLVEVSSRDVKTIGVSGGKGDVAVFLLEGFASNIGTTQVIAGRVALEQPTWSPKMLSGADSIKDHAVVSDSVGGGWWVAWSDGRSDEGDIYATFFR